jgi:hypothetical protein
MSAFSETKIWRKTISEGVGVGMPVEAMNGWENVQKR